MSRKLRASIREQLSSVPPKTQFLNTHNGYKSVMYGDNFWTTIVKKGFTVNVEKLELNPPENYSEKCALSPITGRSCAIYGDAARKKLRKAFVVDEEKLLFYERQPFKIRKTAHCNVCKSDTTSNTISSRSSACKPCGVKLCSGNIESKCPDCKYTDYEVLFCKCKDRLYKPT